MDLQRRIINDIVIPIGRPVYWLSQMAYKLFFGWLDESFAKRNERRLAADIEMAMPFLFSAYCGRVLPHNDTLNRSLFDYATVTVRINSFMLRFTRGRGELSVAASPLVERPDWYDLGSLLALIDNVPGDNTFSSSSDIWRVAAVIEPRMKDLSEVLSAKEFSALREKLAESQKANAASIRILEDRINSRLKLDGDHLEEK